MTPRTGNEKRRAAAVVTATIATAAVALPGLADPASCGGDAPDRAFCVVEEVLEYDPFTVLDDIRAMSDRTREFGQQLNENNQRYYEESKTYTGPDRVQMATDYAGDQAEDVGRDAATIDGEVQRERADAEEAGGQAAGDVGDRADETQAEVGRRYAEVEQKVAEERAAAERRAAEEQAAALGLAGEAAGTAVATADDAQADAVSIGGTASGAAVEASGDAQQQVADQTAQDPDSPASNWRRNTERDVREFADDVSPVRPSGATTPSASDVEEVVCDLVTSVR